MWVAREDNYIVDGLQSEAIPAHRGMCAVHSARSNAALNVFRGWAGVDE